MSRLLDLIPQEASTAAQFWVLLVFAVLVFAIAGVSIQIWFLLHGDTFPFPRPRTSDEPLHNDWRLAVMASWKRALLARLLVVVGALIYQWPDLGLPVWGLYMIGLRWYAKAGGPLSLKDIERIHGAEALYHRWRDVCDAVNKQGDHGRRGRGLANQVGFQLASEDREASCFCAKCPRACASCIRQEEQWVERVWCMAGPLQTDYAWPNQWTDLSRDAQRIMCAVESLNKEEKQQQDDTTAELGEINLA